MASVIQLKEQRRKNEQQRERENLNKNKELLTININDIVPYENNPRNNDAAVDAVANSIKEFGFKVPIIIDKNNVIVAGHTRLKAAQKLGLEEVPVIIADDLTDDQIKAFRLADNKVGELAEWDFTKLEKELEMLDFDMGDFGFDMKELLKEFDENKEVVEDDFDTEEAIKKIDEPITQLGDIWLFGEHRLMCGDSTDALNVDLLMNGNKADLVFTDPPYGIDVVSDDGKVGADFGVAKKGNYSKVISDDTTETAKEAYKILKTMSDKLIIWGGNYFINFLDFSDGWVIWDKRCDSGIRNTFADGEMAWCSFHTPVRIYRQLWNGMIREGEHETRVHPTQKPIKMLSEILKDFSKENEIVLDVFGGSGSTLIACEQLDRKCYMMELDPKYCDVIIQRWETLTGQKARLDGVE